jgi:hypothetical protein
MMAETAQMKQGTCFGGDAESLKTQFLPPKCQVFSQINTIE